MPILEFRRWVDDRHAKAEGWESAQSDLRSAFPTCFEPIGSDQARHTGKARSANLAIWI
jgi:hypothetical protein